MQSKYEVCVIGSGIGGLCAAALLAKEGKNVVVFESHSKPGGVAHSFSKNGFKFESGPSLWSGINTLPTNNPLGQILRSINEKVTTESYNNWKVFLPEGDFNMGVGNDSFNHVISNIRNQKALTEWKNFIDRVHPIAEAANSIPLVSFNPTTAGILNIIKENSNFIKHLKSIKYLNGSFNKIVDENITDSFLKNYINLLCFLISGMEMKDTNSAAMSTLFSDWFSNGSTLEYPYGGSESIVNALVNGLKKYGGEIYYNSKVKEITTEGKRVSGIILDNNEKINCNYVVSNADIWSSLNMLKKYKTNKWYKKRIETKKCNSFLHMHLGFNSEGLKNLPLHSIWVGNWQKGITAERNCVILSIPSIIDKDLSPKGFHLLHGYTPANEPWDIWKDIKYKSPEYEKLKQERCSIFWKPLEKLIPDIKDRIEIQLLGTPLTHRIFTNTSNGSYGPAISANKSLFPSGKTPIKNLYLCGSSTFPGIGVPPVAASGALAAYSILGIKLQKNFIKELQI